MLCGFDTNNASNEMMREQLHLLREYANGHDIIISSRTSISRYLHSFEGVLIDALLGSGTQGAPRTHLHTFIREMNANPSPILSLDVPSGLDCLSGEIQDPCIQATWTFNFHIPKTSQFSAEARQVINELWTADTDLSYTMWNRAHIGVKSLQTLYNSAPISRLY